MANRDKFLHNINKARRQRKNEQDIQADKLKHMDNMIAVRKLKIRNQYNRELLEQKFLESFNPFNTTNLKNNKDV